MRRLALVVLFAVVFAPVAAASADTAAGGEPPPKVKIEMLDRGAEPRQELRLDVDEGDEFPLSLTIRQTLEQTIDGATMPSVAVPPVRQDMVNRVLDVTPRGRVAYEFETEGVEVLDDGTADPELVERLEEELEPLQELRGRAVVTSRNVTVEAAVDVPEDADPLLEQILDQLTNQLLALSAPYPRAAVGVGARWSVSSSLVAAGIDTDIVSEYEVLELEDSRVVLAVSLEQTAEPQAVDLPGVPASADVRITEFRNEGSGTVTIDLTAISPVSGDLSASGDQSFTVDAGGVEQDLDQTISLGITIESGAE